MKRLSAIGLALISILAAGKAAAQTPTVVSIRLTRPLSSNKSHSGERFVATLAEPLIINNRIVAMKDAVVTGEIRDVVKSGGLSHPASITLNVRTVETHSARYPLETVGLTVKEDSNVARNVLIIGGSASAGPLMGASAGRGQGAAIVSLAGPSTGELSAFLTDKREITLPSKTVLTFYVTTVKISPKQLA